MKRRLSRTKKRIAGKLKKRKKLSTVSAIILLFIASFLLVQYTTTGSINLDISDYLSTIERNVTDYSQIECFINSECVPAECCHPTACTTYKNKPDCNDIACTEECQPGSMDCGQGRCGCIRGKCRVVK